MGAGRGAGRGNLESVRRACRTLFFMVIMVGSLFVSSAPLLVCIADICTVFSAFTCCTSCFSFRVDWAIYSFRGSLVDIPLLSIARSLAAFVAYTICGTPSLCHGPYLGITLVFGIATTAFLSAKVCFYGNFESPLGSPVAIPESSNRLALPLLLISSAVFALVHIFVAYKARCHARRKLCFERTDPEGGSVCKISINGYPRNPRASSPPLFRKIDLESNFVANPQQDDDIDIPARMLADVDSLFMDCKGLVVHYKITEGNSPSSQAPSSNTYDSINNYGISSSISSPSFSTVWNPLVRAPTTGSLFSSSVHTPLLSSHSSFKSSSQSGTPSDLNGWPAIMQDTQRGMSEGLGLPSLPSSNGNGDCSNARTTGVVFLHGFGGGVFSWRHVMSTVAREVGCRVVAFDRPGWGLTSRPRRSEWEQKGLPNPYDLHTQVDLLFAFCQELGLTSVVLVGHADGGLLALMAAARALKSKDSIQLEVKGLVLLGVSLAREVVPSFARVLLHTSLGRHMLRPLLRSEIGQVTTRRAWHDTSKLTSETLDLYKAPLHVEGWDKALSEVSKTSMVTAVLSTSSAAELVRCVGNLPALIVAGVQDRLVPLKAAQSLTSQLPNSRFIAIPGCGHLPHEECPGALLAAMVPFISRELDDEARYTLSRKERTLSDPFSDRTTNMLTDPFR
jgi:pimeloyl-ACP methyl ester carboxylesterase